MSHALLPEAGHHPCILSISLISHNLDDTYTHEPLPTSLLYTGEDQSTRMALLQRRRPTALQHDASLVRK